MKVVLLVIWMGVILSVCHGEQKNENGAQKLEEVYKTGVRYMTGGDYDNAEKYFKAVLKAHPKHGNARFYLLQLDDLREKAQKTLSKTQLKGVVIEKLDLQDVPLSEAVEGLKILIDRGNGEEKAAPNIVLRDPENKISEKKVTLSLNQVPAEVALNYILDLTSTAVSYSEHIITLYPR